jgi:hypothetical protein
MGESKDRGHGISTYLSDLIANESDLIHDLIGFLNFFSLILDFFLGMWSSFDSSLLFFLDNSFDVVMVAKVDVFNLNERLDTMELIYLQGWH